MRSSSVSFRIFGFGDGVFLLSLSFIMCKLYSRELEDFTLSCVEFTLAGVRISKWRSFAYFRSWVLYFFPCWSRILMSFFDSRC